MAREEMESVWVDGRKMAETWWGMEWDRNLERYSDYENRIGRGRSYLRNRAVIDLKIREGQVKANVQGSRSRPYSVTVDISPMPADRQREVMDRCGMKVKTVEELVNGNIPEEVRDVVVSERGLFPRPSEISFECTCPDWASMCKHVAAVLYGIGRKFDQDPLLFFTLRGIDFEPLIGRTVDQKLDMILANADKPSPRIIDDCDLDRLFGILKQELDNNDIRC